MVNSLVANTPRRPSAPRPRWRPQHPDNNVRVRPIREDCSLGGEKWAPLSIAAIAAMVLLSGCGAINPTIVGPIDSAVDSSVGDRVEIDFRSYLDVDWDEMGIVCPFTTNDTVEEGLGFKWPGAPRIDSNNSTRSLSW